MITITKKEFQQLADYIKDNYGIHLKEEKMALVMGRLQNVLIQNGFRNFTDYYKYIISDTSGKAIHTLVNKITTNHTFFMREEDHFTYFKEKVLPTLDKTLKVKDLRIWSAGCSSGEEPYTLAMIIDDYFGNEKTIWDAKVLATDISSYVLDKAKKGVYHNEKLDSLPKHWKLNYFTKLDYETSIITDKIRSEVIFRQFNLMEEVFPFRQKFQVIFCRNVMIYFDNETKSKLIQKFYNSLEYGGYLFIGHSETINREESNFKYIMPAVYKKQ